MIAKIVSRTKERCRRHVLVAHMVCLTVLVTIGVRADQPGIHDMPRVGIEVAGQVFNVRLADSPAHRAVGFQHVAPDAMDGVAIYFAYDRARKPVYHMRNVARPLLIAWIVPDGTVHEVARMEPGGRVYPAPVAVTGVLEFTASHRLAEVVRPGARVELPSGAR